MFITHVVMMLRRSLRIVVATKLVVAGDLIGVEKGAGFQMRHQVHRPQAALQLGDRRRCCREAV